MRGRKRDVYFSKLNHTVSQQDTQHCFLLLTEKKNLFSYSLDLVYNGLLHKKQIIVTH